MHVPSCDDRLKLDDDVFVKIQPLEQTDEWSRRPRPQQQKDPPPEKYSIEWYMLEAEKRKRARERQVEQSSATPALIACGGILSATTALLLLKQM